MRATAAADQRQRRGGSTLVLLVAFVCAQGAACAHGPDAMATADDGGDVPTAPRQKEGGDWISLEGPLGWPQLDVLVLVNGTPVIATLDTGAMRTSMSEPVAARLGLTDLVDESEVRGRAEDAHGDFVETTGIRVRQLTIGKTWMDDVPVQVLHTPREVFLVGLDLLQRFEMVLALEEGLVGLFPPGGAPRGSDDIVIPLERIGSESAPALIVKAEADGAPGAVARALLIVDTGAQATAFPAAPALAAGVPTDLRFKTTSVGVAGTREERGRFRLEPLLLGAHAVDVGAVIAWESVTDRGEGAGLLGLDALGRFRTVIVPGSATTPAELRLRPLPKRTHAREVGPGGVKCRDVSGVPCVSVGLMPMGLEDTVGATEGMLKRIVKLRGEQEMRDAAGLGDSIVVGVVAGRSDMCLHVHLDAVWSGHTVELAIGDDGPAPGGQLAGGLLTVVARPPAARLDDPVVPFERCLPLLPSSTKELGLDGTVPLVVRFLRVDGAVKQRCDDEACLFWGGAR